MPKVECFLIVPTTHVVHQLRRYSSKDQDCPMYGYHNAMSPVIGMLELSIPVGPTEAEPIAPSVDASYPLWPAKCDHCDYLFEDKDPRQSWTERQWRRADDPGEASPLLSIRHPPVGAIWDCWWFGSHRAGPDGLHLCVMTPGGEWLIDGPAKNGPGWTRTGEPPRITARPSILIEGRTPYHGFLTDGFLEEC